MTPPDACIYHPVLLVRTVEWLGSAFGLLGAALLALNVAVSRWGWVFFLASNFALIPFAVLTGAHGLFVLQVGFTATSLVGIFRAFDLRRLRTPIE